MESLEQNKDGNVKEIIKFTLIALAIFIPLRFFVIEPFIVVGPSMDPTFESGHYLMVDQISYYFQSPARGDIVIFKQPPSLEKYLIKRIIGLPGETLDVEKGKIKITNNSNPSGIDITDDFVTPEHRTLETFRITLGPTEYFVMGDNRNVSLDSRSWGPLESKYIVGRPVIRLIPFGKIGLFPGAEIL